ncbi:hypothetical protein [Desulfobulbus sp.]|uniref:hypothetical protein n=1 Tax=Desulfobulbus sp. TaxID=895 RepID=UPI00286F9E7C|nr:hypothetical protein [Desulfobulbus sp.]
MGGPRGQISTSELRAAMVLRQCPVTCGRPTRMTERSFTAMCEHHRKNEAAWTNDHNGSSRESSWCATCKGKHRPRELSIIALADFARKEKRTKEECMAPRKQTTCDGCGKNKTLSMCSGEMLCSSCAALAGNVVRQPAAVAKMLVKRGKPEEFVGLLVAEMGQDWLKLVVQSHLPEPMAAVEQPDAAPLAAATTNLAQFAEDMGGPEVLLARLVDELGREWLAGALQSLLPERVTMDVENDALNRIAEAVGYDVAGGEDLVAAVVNMAVRMEVANEEAAAKQGIINQISEAIGYSELTDDELVEVVNKMASASLQRPEQSTSGDKENDAERIRLQAEIDRVAAELVLSPVSGELLEIKSLSVRSSLDSHLLDLALDAMRGNVTGLDPDRIAVLREAA